MADGRRVPVDRGPGTPVAGPLRPHARGGVRERGRGAGRSARGLPIVWESPGVESLDELRGSLWAVSPSGVPGAAGPRKRRGSGLADEGVAKKRREGRTCTYVLDRGGTQHPPE